MFYRVNTRAEVYPLKLPGVWEKWRGVPQRFTYANQFSVLKKNLVVEAVTVSGAFCYDRWTLIKVGKLRCYICDRDITPISPLEALARIKIY